MKGLMGMSQRVRQRGRDGAQTQNTKKGVPLVDPIHMHVDIRQKRMRLYTHICACSYACICFVVAAYLPDLDVESLEVQDNLQRLYAVCGYRLRMSMHMLGLGMKEWIDPGVVRPSAFFLK